MRDRIFIFRIGMIRLNLLNLLIQPGLCAEFRRRAELGHLAVIQHQHLIRLGQGGDPVGNQDDGGGAEPLLQRGADLRVRFCIHRGEGIVKDHDRRGPCQHAGNGRALLLAAGQGDAPLAHEGIVALAEAGNGFIQAGRAGRGLHFLLRQVRCGDAQVLPQRPGEEEGLLQHDADIPPQMRQPDLPDIRSADGDPPAVFRKGIQPVQQVHHGGFARAGAAQDTQGGSGGNRQVDIVQHLRAAFIGEGHMLEADVAVHGRLQCIRIVLFLFRVHDIADPVDADAGLGHFGNHAAQLAHRPDQHSVIGKESDKLAGGHGIFLPQAEDHAEDDHQHDLYPGEDIRRAPEEGHQPAKLHPQVRVEIVLLTEAVPLIALPAESPHHADAGQVLLHHGGELAFVLVAFLEALAELMMEEQGIPDDNRQRNHGDQRQGHVHAEHEDHGHDQHEQDAHQDDQLLGNEIPRRVDVRRTALDDIAGMVLHMPLEGQPLDMIEQRIPHVLHQGFAAPCVEHTETVGGSGLEQGHHHHGQRHDPQVPPQVLRPAEGFHQGADEGAQVVHGRGAHHVVHGDADDLGHHGFREADDRRAEHGGDEEAFASF